VKKTVKKKTTLNPNDLLEYDRVPVPQSYMCVSSMCSIAIDQPIRLCLVHNKLRSGFRIDAQSGGARRSSALNEGIIRSSSSSSSSSTAAASPWDTRRLHPPREFSEASRRKLPRPLGRTTGSRPPSTPAYPTCPTPTGEYHPRGLYIERGDESNVARSLFQSDDVDAVVRDVGRGRCRGRGRGRSRGQQQQQQPPPERGPARSLDVLDVVALGGRRRLEPEPLGHEPHGHDRGHDRRPVPRRLPPAARQRLLVRGRGRRGGGAGGGRPPYHAAAAAAAAAGLNQYNHHHQNHHHHHHHHPASSTGECLPHSLHSLLAL
jgi:hypothetical protein